MISVSFFYSPFFYFFKLLSFPLYIIINYKKKASFCDPLLHNIILLDLCARTVIIKFTRFFVLLVGLIYLAL